MITYLTSTISLGIENRLRTGRPGFGYPGEGSDGIFLFATVTRG